MLTSVGAGSLAQFADQPTRPFTADLAHTVPSSEVRYWASYTEEIDAEIAAAEAAEASAEDAWRRERRLLAG